MKNKFKFDASDSTSLGRENQDLNILVRKLAVTVIEGIIIKLETTQEESTSFEFESLDAAARAILSLLSIKLEYSLSI